MSAPIRFAADLAAGMRVTHPVTKESVPIAGVTRVHAYSHDLVAVLVDLGDGVVLDLKPSATIPAEEATCSTP